MSKEKAMAKRLKNIPCCPECGYEMRDGDTAQVADWALQVAGGEFENGVLFCDGHWELTQIWKNEEEITCPRCDKIASANDWGVELEYI